MNAFAGIARDTVHAKHPVFEAPEHRPRVAIAPGDGIGPEIMCATMRVLEAGGASLDYDFIEVGEQVYHQGVTSGIGASAWETLRRTGVLLKGPITTPRGSGYKSLNVTMRKSLGLFANVRPCVSYASIVRGARPGLDLVIVRENEEDTYAGIEHRQTREVTQCLKLMSRPGCERVIRYAFEYARQNGRRKITCMTKSNIMKLTDGLFEQVFHEIAEDYPGIQPEHWIIDIGAALMAEKPEQFDVIVTPNLYGDILSDIAAQLSGSVGLGASSNIGERFAMFEAIHGSAPGIAGEDIANPSGLLLAAVQMLVHLGQPEAAARIHNALLRTLEDGVHTLDIAAQDGPAVGTQAFAEAVCARLGLEPRRLTPVRYEGVGASGRISMPERPRGLAVGPRAVKTLDGVDIFLDWDAPGRRPEMLGHALQAQETEARRLKMITNRGVKVFPDGLPETFCTDHWRCRFVARDEHLPLHHQDLIALLQHLVHAGFDVIKTENLYRFDGQPGYSLGQGE